MGTHRRRREPEHREPKTERARRMRARRMREAIMRRGTRIPRQLALSRCVTSRSLGPFHLRRLTHRNVCHNLECSCLGATCSSRHVTEGSESDLGLYASCMHDPIQQPEEEPDRPVARCRWVEALRRPVVRIRRARGHPVAHATQRASSVLSPSLHALAAGQLR